MFQHPSRICNRWPQAQPQNHPGSRWKANVFSSDCGTRLWWNYLVRNERLGKWSRTQPRHLIAGLGGPANQPETTLMDEKNALFLLCFRRVEATLQRCSGRMSDCSDPFGSNRFQRQRIGGGKRVVALQFSCCSRLSRAQMRLIGRVNEAADSRRPEPPPNTPDPSLDHPAEGTSPDGGAR